MAILQALKGECLSSVFSPDGTLISASAAPHCGAVVRNHQYFHVHFPNTSQFSYHFYEILKVCQLRTITRGHQKWYVIVDIYKKQQQKGDI